MEKKGRNPNGNKKKKVLSPDDELIFKGNFIWQVKDNGSYMARLDHCNCCNIDVTINVKNLQEHYTCKFYRNRHKIHSLLPLFPKHSMEWMDTKKSSIVFIMIASSMPKQRCSLSILKIMERLKR